MDSFAFPDKVSWAFGVVIFIINKLVEATEERIEDEDGEYETYSDLGGGEYETFEKTYTTKNGDIVVAFGFYGYD